LNGHPRLRRLTFFAGQGSKIGKDLLKASGLVWMGSDLALPSAEFDDAGRDTSDTKLTIPDIPTKPI
jgi:hypothetical protein